MVKYEYFDDIFTKTKNNMVKFENSDDIFKQNHDILKKKFQIYIISMYLLHVLLLSLECLVRFQYVVVDV